MKDTKSARIPKIFTCALVCDDDEIKYHGMIESLLFLTTSLPNILFSICKCARF